MSHQCESTHRSETSANSLQYYFDIAPEAFEEALDRFSGFFTAPLFNAACTEREVNAVNAEQNKNLQNDAWRHIQLHRHLASPGHPFHMFAVGSRETLWDAPKREGRDPRAELIEWWKKTYCAKRMKLVLVAQENVNTLERWVRERFEAVPVRTMDGDERLVYSQEVMEEERLGVSRKGSRPRPTLKTFLVALCLRRACQRHSQPDNVLSPPRSRSIICVQGRSLNA